ncbi:nuclear condensing complex subunit [Infundibulicybe gibba]|nr:nuclear condensing complex subunit [Infundibulicybe gibba]
MAVGSQMALEDVRESVATIFDQVQASLANHRKNYGGITQPAKNGTAVRLVGEKAFGDAFIDMMNRVLFVGAYVKYVNEKGELFVLFGRETGFISRLLKWLSPGFVAKTRSFDTMISHLDVYSILRDNLIERLGDRESLIRAHAVIALSKLIGSEDPSELEEGEKTILEILLDVVCYDTAPEVRRAALLNIPLTPISLETILSRTRDTDTLIRRLVFAVVLQAKLSHPKQLSVAQREQIVKDGLGDREPVVRVAAGKMVAKDEPSEETWVGDDGGVMKGLIKFLSLFDVVGPTQIVAVDAIMSIFVTRPDLPQVFSFSDAFWKELSPESAVLARVFVEDCIESHNEARLENASLPVVTAFAFYIQEAYNALLEPLQDLENARFLNGGEIPDDEESEKRDEDIAKQEVVLGELLRIALRLDYMDEIGRRKVFSVVKDMLAHPELPTSLIERCLDILKVILPSERELIRVVVEIVIELREDNGEEALEGLDPAEMDDSRSDITSTRKDRDRSLRRNKQTELTPEQKAQADLVDQRCLTLCIGMLERVDGSFEDNSTLEGILSDLIIPSVKRKELVMREKGLISLGLCCLIAKNMALNSFQLFLSQVQNAPESLKLRQEFFGRSEDVVSHMRSNAGIDESDAVQAVLTSLVLVYVSASTADNQELRQCLSYFFPVYCYSSPANQARIQSIFIRAFDLVTQARDELEEGQTMIAPYQFGLLLVDWTDPQKAADVYAHFPLQI